MLFRLALVTVLVGVVAGCDLRPPPKGGPGSGGMVDPSTEGSAAGSAVPSMQVTPVGAPAIGCGVTLFDGDDGSPVPNATLAAVTVKVYATPLVRPGTISGEALPIVVNPPGFEVTV